MSVLRRELEPRFRRDLEPRWPQLMERGLLDWPLDAWRRLIDEEQVNVEEFTEGNQPVIRAELPGVDPERDVDISIVDGKLCIRAERRQERQVNERDYRRSEIRYGSFSRALPLPPNAKDDDIEASYKDGILEVRAPLAAEPASASKIAIKRD